MRCKHCGKDISGKRADAVYCSRKCIYKAYREANPEKVKANSRAHYEANAEKVKAHQKAWREANAEKEKARQKAYREANPEKRKAAVKAWAEANAEKRKAYSKAYYEANAEKVKAYLEVNAEKIKARDKAYREANPEKVKARCQRRRTLKAYLPATFTVEQWKRALAYFENTCAYCGEELTKVHQEHFVPLSKGGGYTRDNIVPSCPRCNMRKNNRNPLDWLVKQVHGLVAYVRIMQYLEGF
jgi:5-methylcytosine-specific restriction endonuclease McrA